MSNEHRTITLHHPDGEYSADIDEKIAPLIAAMWSKGWATYNSCEDNHGFIWVEMAYPHAEEFLTIVARNACQPVAMEARTAHTNWRGDHNSRHPDEWDLSIHANNVNEALDEESDEIVDVGPPDMVLTVSVRFPPQHLNEVTRVVGVNSHGRHHASRDHRIAPSTEIVIT